MTCRLHVQVGGHTSISRMREQSVVCQASRPACSAPTCCGRLDGLKEVGVVPQVELHGLVGHLQLLGLHLHRPVVVLGLRARLVDAVHHTSTAL